MRSSDMDIYSKDAVATLTRGHFGSFLSLNPILMETRNCLLVCLSVYLHTRILYIRKS